MKVRININTHVEMFIFIWLVNWQNTIKNFTALTALLFVFVR